MSDTVTNRSLIGCFSFCPPKLLFGAVSTDKHERYGDMDTIHDTCDGELVRTARKVEREVHQEDVLSRILCEGVHDIRVSWVM